MGLQEVVQAYGMDPRIGVEAHMMASFAPHAHTMWLHDLICNLEVVGEVETYCERQPYLFKKGRNVARGDK